MLQDIREVRGRTHPPKYTARLAVSMTPLQKKDLMFFANELGTSCSGVVRRFVDVLGVLSVSMGIPIYEVDIDDFEGAEQNLRCVELFAYVCGRDVASVPNIPELADKVRMTLKDMETTFPREVKILKLRWGIGHDKIYALDEVAEEVNLTKARIRQIEGIAMRALRHPRRTRAFREWIDVMRSVEEEE